MTISSQDKSQYERQCNAAAGYCAAYTKPLSGETYFCDDCAHEAYVETDPHGVMHDEEAEKAVQES